ncbi:MAG: hypothetical protein Q9170_002050 [Blastenia crenularia]
MALPPPLPLESVGHHLEHLTDDNLTIYFKLLAAVQFSFGLSLGLAKVSICLLLERIFFVVREFRILARGVMIYCACWTIMTIAVGAALCQPFAYNWDKSVKGGRCGALVPAYISIAALDILGDAMIIVIFAMGLLDIVVAILRIVYLINFIDTPDFTWDAYTTYLWATVEVGLSITIACAPTLRTLVNILTPIVKKGLPGYRIIYPRRPRREPEHYSNISNGEVPLRPFKAFDSQAQGGNESNPFEASTITEAAASSESAYSDPQNRVSDPEVIRVQKDVSVQRGSRGSGFT